MINKITSVIMVIFAIALIYMGGQLLLAGGSAFYALMGVGVLLSAVLLWMKKRSALTLYALLMWITLFWMIREVGFDKWQ